MLSIVITNMEYDEEDQIPTPMRTLWEENYPFDYWQNRIFKINPYNPQDKMEALFTLLQLSDTYATILAAKLRNPYAPWYVVTEELKPTREIHQTLEKLQVTEGDRTYIELMKLEEEPAALVNFEIKEEWAESLTTLDLLAADLLGCPAKIDEEGKDIEFIDRPEKYVAACNAVVNFWKDHTQLLNDLKHGFRLLPFDRDTFEDMIEMGLLHSSDDSVDIEAKLDEYQRTKDEYLYFWRLEVDELADPDEFDTTEDVEIGMRLVVYRTDATQCKELADITLRLLHNLFGRGGENRVVDSIQSLVGEGNESMTMLDDFLRGELVYATGRPEGAEDLDK